jgi:hypothetical protein
MGSLVASGGARRHYSDIIRTGALSHWCSECLIIAGFLTGVPDLSTGVLARWVFCDRLVMYDNTTSGWLQTAVSWNAASRNIKA